MMLQQPLDKSRLCITVLTVIYLAFAAQATLSFLFSAEYAEYGPITLEILGNGGSRNGQLWIKALLTDGRLLRWESAGNLSGLELEDNHGMPSNLFYKGSEPGVFTFQAKRFALVLQPTEWSGVIRVKRHNRTVQMMDVSAKYFRHPIVLEHPAAPRSIAVFLGALILCAACAWWFGPWTIGRKSAPWLIFFLIVIHLLYWAGQTVGTNNDSQAYLEAASALLRGTPSDKPPGYGVFLATLGSLAGQSLGAWTALLQHSLIVLSAVWIYFLLQRTTTDKLALSAAMLAGALAPAMTVPQGILSESTTTFAMIGALYFAVRSTETNNLAFAILAGACAAWAGLLRVSPLPALIVATSILYLAPRVKSRRRFIVTPVIATLIFSAPLIWCGLKSGEAKLTNSIGTHFHNRVIREQGLLNSSGPATQRLVNLLGGRDPRGFYSWELLPLSAMRALPWPEQDLLLQHEGMEGISKNPLAFVRYTFHLAWREFLIPTDWIPTWADAFEVSPHFENSPPLGVAASSLAWRWTLEDVQIVVWPVLCWAAIIGVLLGLLSQQRYVVLPMTLTVIGYLLPTAAAEIFCPRYNAPIAPFVTALAILPLEWVRRRMWKPLHIGPASVQVPERVTAGISSQ